MIFSKKKQALVITAVNSITSVGQDAYMTAGAAYSKTAMLREWDGFYDSDDNPIVISNIEGISWKRSQEEYMYEVAEKCFNDLVDEYFDKGCVNDICIILGLPHEDKLKERNHDKWEEFKEKLLSKAGEKSQKVNISAFYCGNPSVFYALKKAEQDISKNPSTTFILGSFDSLLDMNTLKSLDKDRRIKSVSYGRNQGLVPSHGSGFMVIESKDFAVEKEKDILVQIKGSSIAMEPSPRSSKKPTRYSGLTEAIGNNLKDNKLNKADIMTVFSDMNGEYFRAKEWSFAEIRCLKKNDHELVHPADCFGAIGAASSSVLTNLASVYLSENWIENDALVVCSDDHGYCGSLVLGKPVIEQEK